MRQSRKERIRLEAGRRFTSAASEDEKLTAAHVLYAIGQRGSGPLPSWIYSQGSRWGVA